MSVQAWYGLPAPWAGKRDERVCDHDSAGSAGARYLAQNVYSTGGKKAMRCISACFTHESPPSSPNPPSVIVHKKQMVPVASYAIRPVVNGLVMAPPEVRAPVFCLMVDVSEYAACRNWRLALGATFQCMKP